MKKNQGITLISLIVYIIVMLIAISLIAMITTSIMIAIEFKSMAKLEKAQKNSDTKKEVNNGI